MKDVNLKSVRAKLPRGSIVRIAEAMDVSPAIVSHVLNDNWYPQYHNEVLRQSIAIIRDLYPDDGLLQEAEELGISGGSVFSHPRKKRKANPDDDDHESGLGVLGSVVIAAVAAVILIPGLLDKIKSMFSGKGSNTLTLTEAQQKIYDDYLKSVK